MYKLLKNKKGDVGNIMEDTISLFLIVVLVVAFFVFAKLYFTFSEKQIDIQIEKNSKFSEIQFAVQQIENSTFEVNDEIISFSQLTRLSKTDKKYETILHSKINEIKSTYPTIEIKEIPYDSNYKNYGDKSYLIISSSKPIIFEVSKK